MTTQHDEYLSLGKKKKRPIALSRHNFDGIANKFDKNIYGTSKGQLRHRLLLGYLSKYLDCEHALTVLDAGGGTGMMSRDFAQRDHKVTLIDSSNDVLDIARERLKGFDNCSIIQTGILDIDTAVATQTNFDLVLCHAVLEWLPNPFEVIQFIIDKLLKPSGILSLSFFNYDAMLLNNVLYGNFDYVKSGLKVRNTVRLNPHNPQKPQEVIQFIKQNTNAEVIHHAGIRCFHDYMLDKSKVEHEFEALYEMEKTYGSKAPYKWIGKYCHLLIKKTELKN
ncbi:methyltransferase domain-containing protein [Glaciecola sp. KUL10]|uniref:methyltransferase domain-containing protein n=1 Tax=Glaciecola sp. (strain KUL10) TaxID=2161813 RepID=UPI001F1F35C2|nr:methyltransferase domain-containing protein [Glaciecola sp. KUL10]